MIEGNNEVDQLSMWWLQCLCLDEKGLNYYLLLWVIWFMTGATTFSDCSKWGQNEKLERSDRVHINRVTFGNIKIGGKKYMSYMYNKNIMYKYE